MSTSSTPFPIILDEISKTFGMFQALRTIHGPLSYRKALDVSAKQLGQWLGHYTQRRPPTANALYVWERVERNAHLPTKYAMTPATREAYGQLLRDVVNTAGKEKFQLKATMGPRRWSFELLATCTNCGRWFPVKRATQVRCRRCIAKGRR